MNPARASRHRVPRQPWLGSKNKTGDLRCPLLRPAGLLVQYSTDARGLRPYGTGWAGWVDGTGTAPREVLPGYSTTPLHRQSSYFRTGLAVQDGITFCVCCHRRLWRFWA